MRPHAQGRIHSRLIISFFCEPTQVKINNIVNQVAPGVECSFYVDDFVIMYKSPTMDAIQRKLQQTINKLEKWTLVNGFTFSKNKTVAMHFCPDKKCRDPVLTLGGSPIEFVKETKFLGLIWDKKAKAYF